VGGGAEFIFSDVFGVLVAAAGGVAGTFVPIGGEPGITEAGGTGYGVAQSSEAGGNVREEIVRLTYHIRGLGCSSDRGQLAMTTRKTNLADPIYHDDDAARAHLEALLWQDGPVCPRCGVFGDRITKLQGASTRPGVYKRKDCRKPFSVTVGTVM
jgi:hypothetical protein